MNSKLPSPAEVVDHAFYLVGQQRLTVHALGQYARWNPSLLLRAHNEAVRRWNLAINNRTLNWSEGHQYSGVVNAISLASENAMRGPRRRGA